MPEILPVPPPSGYLATSGRRAVAAEMIDTAGSHLSDGLYVAEVLDLTAGVLLRVAGVDDAASRQILASLWAGQ